MESPPFGLPVALQNILTRNPKQTRQRSDSEELRCLKHAGARQKGCSYLLSVSFLSEAGLHANTLTVPHVTPVPMDRPSIECTHPLSFTQEAPTTTTTPSGTRCPLQPWPLPPPSSTRSARMLNLALSARLCLTLAPLAAQCFPGEACVCPALGLKVFISQV